MHCVTAPMRADSFTMAALAAHLFPTVQVEVKHLVRREAGINVGKVGGAGGGGGTLLSMMARVTIKGVFFSPLPTSFQLMAAHGVNAEVVLRRCRFSDRFTDLHFTRGKTHVCEGFQWSTVEE